MGGLESSLSLPLGIPWSLQPDNRLETWQHRLSAPRLMVTCSYEYDRCCSAKSPKPFMDYPLPVYMLFSLLFVTGAHK